MPRITDLKLQQRDKSWCNVFLDGAYAFAVPLLRVSEEGLRLGQELRDDQAAELQESATEDREYKLALQYVSRRVRSTREVGQYLRRKGVESEVIQRVLGRLVQSGLLNDQEYAAMWVRDRLNLRPRSRRQLEQELSGKGIERHVIEIVLAEVPPEDAQAGLSRIIAKKRRLGMAEEKIKQYLLRQGFSYDEVRASLEQ